MRYRVLLSLFLVVGGCSTMRDKGRPEMDSANRIVFGDGQVTLTLNDALVPDLTSQGRSILRAPESRSLSLNSITVNGEEITGFRVQPEESRVEEIQGSHGAGERLQLVAEAALPAGVIRQKLDVERYDRYPGLLVFRVAYSILGGSGDLRIDRVSSVHLQLDASRSGGGESPFDFHTFQGGSYEWGRSYAGIPLTADFKQKNFMGLYRRPGPEEPEDEGGGINLVDVWNKAGGIALCHLAPKDLFISFPTEVDSDGYVNLRVLEEPDPDLGQLASLGPGQSYHVQAPIGIIVHSGDYFEPLRTYRDLLIDEGVAIQTESPAWTYESYWKTWGWKRNFTLEMVNERIPQLLELGIRQLQIDDGWQDHVGDWNPNPDKYPRGEADVIESVKEMKRLGIERVYLWWNPLGVDPESMMAKKTEWLVLGKDGLPPTHRQHTLCPGFRPVQEHLRGLVRKWIRDWGYDGVYNDFAMNSVAPACFNPAHGHAKPTDSFEATPEIWRIIWEEAHALHPDPFLETCICSLPHSLFKNPYTNMTSASDPVTNFQIRARIKVEKATHGPRWAYTNCYIEEGRRDPIPQLSDADFASSVGIGAILTTFYAKLTPEEFEQYKKWFDIYRKEMLSAGDYLNLYDIIYDKPEAHVVRKGDAMYYGLYADQWAGPIELRGLGEQAYQVLDYVTGRDLGTVRGTDARLDVSFDQFLLLKCVPK